MSKIDLIGEYIFRMVHKNNLAYILNIVKDNNTKEFALQIMSNTRQNIKIEVDENNKYFYP